MAAILVLGSVNVDLVVRSERLPAPGETVLGGRFFTAAGGKGANQAVAAARAGGRRVALIAAVGDDAHGQQALANFRHERIVTERIKIAPGRTTGVALILVDAHGENMISVASGANLELAPQDVLAIPDALFHEARVFLTCLEIPLPTVAHGLARAKAAGLRTILNPAPVMDRAAVLAMLPDVDVLTPNAGEAAALAAIDHGRSQDPHALCRALERLGAKSAVMTLGPAGCLVLESGSMTEIPSHRVESVDATGAGDAFNGALAVALSEGRSLVDAARFANGAAALSVGRAGAQPSLPTREEIDRFALA